MMNAKHSPRYRQGSREMMRTSEVETKLCKETFSMQCVGWRKARLLLFGVSEIKETRSNYLKNYEQLDSQFEIMRAVLISFSLVARDSRVHTNENVPYAQYT